jgi:predicted enzyme related to lactoylglutathione lyase
VSERDGFAPGVPCWIASVHADPEAAVRFYTELFGWEARDAMPPDSPARYFECTLRGRRVAAIGTEPDGRPPRVAAWGTHVWVDSADDTAARVTDAGGRVILEPFEIGDAARVAVLADPAGAIFCLWQPREHRGAQVVNEPGAWAMSQLSTPEPDGAKAFYGEVFGWDTDSFEMGELEVALWRAPGYEGGEPQQPVPRDVVGVMVPTTRDRSREAPPPNWSVDFWVEDVDAAAVRATELGGAVVAPAFDTPVGRTAVLADPHGAAFSVSRVVPG